MIDLYMWGTPNGKKVSIMLEEVGLPYELHTVNIMKDEQFAPEFIKISPNNKIPAIVDRDNGMSLFESGAILMYLAQKTGSLLPASGEARWRTIEWLMWQMGGFGPMLGQAHHFMRAKKGAAPYAEERYESEVKRLYGVLDRRLAQVEYLSGKDYTIADVAIWPWAARFEWHLPTIGEYNNVVRWYRTVAGRPGVQRGFDKPSKPDGGIPMP